MFNDIVDILVIFNLMLCLIIIVWDMYFYSKVPESERWTKILYTLIGFLWFIRYVLYLFNVEPFGSDHFNPILVILVTYTLLSLAVASIIRVHRLVRFEDMKNDLKRWIFRNKK